ncbi:type IV toxin-antitoxin system AbiEi family antitoxin domain-containing protein [Lacisediminihabitans sp.]|uniref:type IV toxin-antitoxin system AbiEi family antitoxin domain-containing protein n=1 Tax=Lacisediminihabitans sp. TaxID=2787631 RepID=UPI00374DCAEF
MRSLSEVVRRGGGVLSTAELLAYGASSHALTAAVRGGVLLRPRQGWYALPGTREDFVRALRVGGRLASVSAAASYGLAVPHDFPLHVHVVHESSRLRTERDRYLRLSDAVGETTVIHRGRVAVPTLATRLRVGLLDCLLQVATTESEEDAVACLDSAIRRGLLGPEGLEWLRKHLPARRLCILDRADGKSDSYPESICRCRLATAGIAARLQVPVLGERWIDLLIGDCLAIEVDGAGKYTQDMTPAEVAKTMNADRLRDAFLEALGYHVIRISYFMVMFDWPATLSMIQAVIERGGHLSRPTR